MDHQIQGQLELFPAGPNTGLRIDLTVHPVHGYVTGRVEVRDASGLARRVTIPPTWLTIEMLGLGDDLRDIATAWLFQRAEEVVRIARSAIERWQDDCDQEGGHPGPNR